LPCGWSKEGLQTFNQLAKEVSKNRKEHGDEFEKAFKISMEQEMENKVMNKHGKRKRNCIDTYNDLNKTQVIMKDDNETSDDEMDEWVRKNAFQV
jgi:acetyl-CoA carboxylase carboxyltransferase component